MKLTRFTDEQKVTILREADAQPIPEVAKKHGVATATIYVWRKHFGGLEPTDVRRLRQPEQENGRLKKLVADHTLDLDVLKEVSRKTWSAYVCAGSSSRLFKRVACLAAARARGYRSRDRRWSISRDSSRRTPRSCRRCGRWRVSTRARATGP